MDILSLAFIVLVVLVVGSAWPGLRSNWRSIQSMHSGQKAALDDAVFDLPEGPDCSHQHGHGHDAGHQGGDATGHVSGDFHVGDHGGFDGGGGHH